MIQLRTERLTRSTKVMAMGMLVAAAMAASLLASSKPAHASVTYIVNSTGDGADLDPQNGVCDANPSPQVVECTLRAAIQESNTLTPGGSTINFNIPSSSGTSIRPNSPLPIIVAQTSIDGYTQPGAHPNTLQDGDDAVVRIELNGELAGNSAGLDIVASNTTVRGLAINRFTGDGILIRGGGKKIEGNFIGTDPSGTQDLGNGSSGVRITSSTSSGDNVVGGVSPASRNLISGNGDSGISIFDSPNNKVQGNYIGTDRSGNQGSSDDLGNDASGVDINGGPGSNNTIGGDSAGADNIISNNDFDGVSINLNSAGNKVLGNSISSNGDLGIDLNDDDRSNTNDPSDTDSGANNLQNFPVLNFAVASGSQTFVSGSLDSTPGKTFKVQVFSSPQKDPSGFGEGQAFLGEKEVTTDSSGKASFLLAAPKPTAVGSFVTATATSASGDTSEFSEGKVASPLPHKKKRHKKRH